MTPGKGGRSGGGVQPLPVPLAERAVEDGVADGDGGVEDVQRRRDGLHDDLRLVAAHDEEGKEDGEDTAGDDDAVGHAREDGEGKAEAEEVGPVVLHVGKALVELEALVEPFVLEGIQREEQAQVHHVHCVA